MIRKCNLGNLNEIETICQIINDAAIAYRGIIPDDCWKEPYMPLDELQHEIENGVEFWGFESDGELTGVMGIQPKADVTLIRHAYVRTAYRNKGIGGHLLTHLISQVTSPILIGTWADASWAIAFYQKHGFKLITANQNQALLKKYWSVPNRQFEVSVVLADDKWFQLTEEITR